MSKNQDTRRAPWLARLSGIMAGLATGLGGVGAAAQAAPQPVSAKTVSPSAAPAEWVRYAEAATATISGWLEEKGEAATRVRAYLDAIRPDGAQPSPPLVLKVWIDPDGRVSRIDHAAFVHEAANADLRTVIVGRALSAPPRDMLLPLRIAVQLEPASEGGDLAKPGDQRRALAQGQ